jgi:bifunctional ADP-heptose synthase (sugar kinase/adenylyltransferase)
MRSHDIEGALITRFLMEVDTLIVDADVVIFSDFNYGCLPDALVDQVISRCASLSIPFLADSQSSSQVGDVSRYRGATLTAATEREVRLAMGDFKSGLQNVANGLLIKARLGGLLLKLGAEGLIALNTSGKYLTDSLGAMNPNAIDPAGAGDAMLATAALVLACGGNVWECAYLGSLASAIQVSRVGNIPLTEALLVDALHS